MSLKTRRRRGRSVAREQFAVAIVVQAPGVVVTNVTSNNGVTVFPDNWLIHGPWTDAAHIESHAEATVT